MKKIVISSVISSVLVIACAINYNSSVSRMNTELSQQENEIDDLKNELGITPAEQMSDTAKSNLEATGLDSERVKRDDAIAEEFLQKVLTWDSGDVYDKMREELFEIYGLDEDSSFAQVFLPVNVKTPDGKYNYIDTHEANSKYESMTSYVSKISDDTYSYFTDVTWSSADLNHNEATATCIFLYDITVDGEIENVEAYTVMP